MATDLQLRSSILGAWRTNCRVTEYLVEHLSRDVLDAAIPGVTPRRAVRMLVGHLHNTRSRWIRTLGVPHGIPAPALVDLRRFKPRELLAALERSGKGIEAILTLGLDSGGTVPATPAYTWRNLPLDVGHVLMSFASHEAHHRGQVITIARQLGKRLPSGVTNELWQWSRLRR
jgi:uncharacterized damage-inducible protein DinB